MPILAPQIHLTSHSPGMPETVSFGHLPGIHPPSADMRLPVDSSQMAAVAFPTDETLRSAVVSGGQTVRRATRQDEPDTAPGVIENIAEKADHIAGRYFFVDIGLLAISWLGAGVAKASGVFGWLADKVTFGKTALNKTESAIEMTGDAMAAPRHFMEHTTLGTLGSGAATTMQKGATRLLGDESKVAEKLGGWAESAKEAEAKGVGRLERGADWLATKVEGWKPENHTSWLQNRTNLKVARQKGVMGEHVHRLSETLESHASLLGNDQLTTRAFSTAAGVGKELEQNAAGHMVEIGNHVRQLQEFVRHESPTMEMMKDARKTMTNLQSSVGALERLHEGTTSSEINAGLKAVKKTATKLEKSVGKVEAKIGRALWLSHPGQAIRALPEKIAGMKVLDAGLNTAIVGNMAYQNIHTAHDIKNAFETLRYMCADLEDKNPHDVSRLHLVSSSVPEAIKVARGQFLKQYGPQAAALVVEDYANIKMMKSGGGMMALMASQALGMMLPSLLPTSPLLQIYGAMRKAHNSGQELGSDAYAQLIAASSHEAEQLADTGAITMLAEHFAQNHLSPAQALKQATAGKISDCVRSVAEERFAHNQLSADDYTALICTFSEDARKCGPMNGLVVSVANHYAQHHTSPSQVMADAVSGQMTKIAAQAQAEMQAHGRKAGQTIEEFAPHMAVPASDSPAQVLPQGLNGIGAANDYAVVGKHTAKLQPKMRQAQMAMPLQATGTDGGSTQLTGERPALSVLTNLSQTQRLETPGIALQAGG